MTKHRVKATRSESRRRLPIQYIDQTRAELFNVPVPLNYAKKKLN